MKSGCSTSKSSILHLATIVAASVLSSCAGTVASSPARGQGSTPPQTLAATATTSASMKTAAAKWSPLSASPLRNRSGFTTVWTGSELLVCCGTEKPSEAALGTSPAQAAAFNPDTDTWRVLAGPPTPVESWGAITVADRSIYFLDGGAAPWSYAAYDIDRDSWRVIPAPPGNDKREPHSRLGPSAWTGKEIVAPIATPPASDHDIMMVAFEPATNTWRTLPSPPSRLEPTSLTFHDGKLAVLGEVRAASDQSSSLVSVTFDMNSNTWGEPQRTPVERRGPQVEGGADRLIAWDVSGTVRVMEDGQWRDLPPIPLPEDECGWKGTQVEKRLVLWRCTQQGAVLDTETGEWNALPQPPLELLDSNIMNVDGHLLLWASATDQLQPVALDVE